ncbi:MAG: T9SS type A sorting domain-containing protein [Chitinophagales bacterium]|nr:T9SS type A sorting domain-containing protein [Chitinophagales bacterium]MBX7224961.1 T9SS type A sorting domain-containing protein [Chitinophagales bacterium]
MKILGYVIFTVLLLPCMWVQGQIRYVDDLSGNIITEYRPYVTYPLSTCWKNGNKPKPNQLIKFDDPYRYNPSDIPGIVPGSSIRNKCFNFYEMYSMKDGYSDQDSTVNVNMKIYSLDNDAEVCKNVVIYLSGAQGFFDQPVLGGGLRYWDRIYNTANDEITIKKQDESICRYLAQKGYLVVALDMRKGWDVKGITNMNGTPELRAYWFHEYCECEGECDKYSVLEANYRNIQDIIAAYGYLLNNRVALNINPNGISLCGNSSGSGFAMLAGFAVDDLPNVSVSEGTDGTGNMTTLQEKHGSLFRYANMDSTQLKWDKLFLLSAGILQLNWIELSDTQYFVGNKKFPIHIMQATEDNVYPPCGGQMRNFKYNGELDSSFYYYGGFAIHDHIMNLPGCVSHLVTQKGMRHGGVFNYHNFSCYNPQFSNQCFESQDIYKEMEDKVALMFYYPVKKTNDYIHVALVAHRKDDQIDGDKCNLCDYIMLAKPDSLGEHSLSCCNYDCDVLFGDNYFRDYDLPEEKNDWNNLVLSDLLLDVMPQVFSTSVIVKINEAENQGSMALKVYNSFGQNVYTENISSFSTLKTINLSSLSKGVYWITLERDNGFIVRKNHLIKQ